ncbi:hypothetical protein ACFWAR_07410 [Streptomyces sp. NPDC059917]|uniref:hypothetical protein n=1 Tax=Streptomyces sp. NPDC059917 TaxID=3347002 RepID=UPI00365C637E
MVVEQRRPRDRVGRSAPYPVVATACLVLAVAAGWSTILLVVLGHVVPGWAVSAFLLALSPALARALAVRHRATVDRAAPWWAPLPRFVRVLLTVAAAVGSALGALDDLGADYHVLRPTGPHGCTVVVRETSFLVAGSGEAYAVGPTGFAWRSSASWTTDDGYRPIATGTYDLNWTRDDGTLTVHGTPTDPVFTGGPHTLTCR